MCERRQVRCGTDKAVIYSNVGIINTLTEEARKVSSCRMNALSRPLCGGSTTNAMGARAGGKSPVPLMICAPSPIRNETVREAAERWLCFAKRIESAECLIPSEVWGEGRPRIGLRRSKHPRGFGVGSSRRMWTEDGIASTRGERNEEIVVVVLKERDSWRVDKQVRDTFAADGRLGRYADMMIFGRKLGSGSRGVTTGISRESRSKRQAS